MVEKRNHISKVRRRYEQDLKNAQSVYRRAKSGLSSYSRKMDTAQEEISEVLIRLNQKESQKQSILRLIDDAKRKIDIQKEEKNEIENNTTFAGYDDDDNDDTKQNAQQLRLKAISEKIIDIDFGIKTRQKMLKGLDVDITSLDDTRNKILAKIKKIKQSSSLLAKLLRDSKKDIRSIITLLEKTVKQEDATKQNLKKAKTKTKTKKAKTKTKKAKTKTKTKKAKTKTKTKKAKTKTKKAKTKTKKR